MYLNNTVISSYFVSKLNDSCPTVAYLYVLYSLFLLSIAMSTNVHFFLQFINRLLCIFILLYNTKLPNYSLDNTRERLKYTLLPAYQSLTLVFSAYLDTPFGGGISSCASSLQRTVCINILQGRIILDLANRIHICQIFLQQSVIQTQIMLIMVFHIKSKQTINKLFPKK